MKKSFFLASLALLAGCHSPSTPTNQGYERPEFFSAGAMQIFNDTGSIVIFPVYRSTEIGVENENQKRAIKWRDQQMVKFKGEGYGVSRLHPMQHGELRHFQCQIVVTFDGSLPEKVTESSCTAMGAAVEFQDTVDLKWSRAYISEEGTERLSFYETFVYDKQ